MFFRVKWLQATMKGTSSVWRLRLGSFRSFNVFCNNGCSCVRSSIRFLNVWLQIAMEWLHECCMGYVVGRKPEHETLCFSVVHTSFAVCNSVSADRIVMAASRLLGAAAACVILL